MATPCCCPQPNCLAVPVTPSFLTVGSQGHPHGVPCPLACQDPGQPMQRTQVTTPLAVESSVDPSRGPCCTGHIMPIPPTQESPRHSLTFLWGPQLIPWGGSPGHHPLFTAGSHSDSCSCSPDHHPACCRVPGPPVQGTPSHHASALRSQRKPPV